MANETPEALAVVALRNTFYRDNHRKIVGLLFLSLLLVIILGGGLAYIVTHPPQPQYFATTIDGRITPLVPLDKPNLSRSAVLQWANTAAIAAYTYNFVNYRQALQEASEYFTPDGWSSFMSALKSSNNLDAVLTKKLIVSAVATDAPIVLAEGELNGTYAWRVQMPMLITYQSASQFSRQSVTITMLITRVPTLNAPRGIGIAQFVVDAGSIDTSKSTL